jgi:hypothetical protein
MGRPLFRLVSYFPDRASLPWGGRQLREHVEDSVLVHGGEPEPLGFEEVDPALRPL